MKVKVNIVEDEWYPVYILDYYFPEQVWSTEVEYEDFLTAMIYDNLRTEANEYIKGLNVSQTS